MGDSSTGAAHVCVAGQTSQTGKQTHRPDTGRPYDSPSPVVDLEGMSLSTLPSNATDATRYDAPVLDVVVPVYNEEIDLEPCVRRLHAYLSVHFPYRFRITVADNAST